MRRAIASGLDEEDNAAQASLVIHAGLAMGSRGEGLKLEHLFVAQPVKIGPKITPFRGPVGHASI